MQSPSPSPVVQAEFKPKLVGIVLLVLALGVLGFALVSRFAALDLARDMRTWQEKLNLIADSRAREMDGWVAHHFTEMKQLAAQPALQLYLSELSTLAAADGRAEPPQRTYLRHLLTFTADRLNFTPAQVPLSVQHIPAQLPFEASSGLALLDTQGHVLVASPYLAALPDAISATLTTLPETMHTLIDIYANPKGEASLGFVEPVFAIQSDPLQPRAVGRIVGIKPLGNALNDLLAHPGTTEETLEVLLVRSENGNVVYLSPTRDGAAPLAKQLTHSPETLAEAFAMTNPGAFITREDYRSAPVFATGRPIAGTPWTLVVKIDEAEALAASNERRQGMVILLSALIALVLATLFAVWYNASSRRAILASQKFQQLAAQATANERLLTLVTDTQTEAVVLLDAQSRYRFANAAAATAAGIAAPDMLGKTVADVMGPARAAELTLHAQAAMAADAPQAYTHRVHTPTGDTVFHTRLTPLHALPIAGHQHVPGVLVSEQEITDLVHERERAQRTHEELIDTLVDMVDRRDPHASNHSKLVSELACEIALALECDTETLATVKTAGLLLNVGKIVVPETLLTSTDRLNDSELKSIRESVYASAALLEGVSFQGPVTRTLVQALEHVDGSGPQGLRGEHILLGARIVAVANTLIGMMSPRAYRAPMGLKDATAALLENVDKIYDRKVVFALVNFLENQGGEHLLTQWLQPRKAA